MRGKATATHCAQGHEWQPTSDNPAGNVRYSLKPNGERRGRYCVVCATGLTRQWRARVRATMQADCPPHRSLYERVQHELYDLIDEGRRR